MSPRVSTDQLLGNIEIDPDVEGYGTSVDTGQHTDTVSGGPERRRQVEKKLLRKLDCRVAFLLLVYIVNFVSFLGSFLAIPNNLPWNPRWTEVI